jgi:hypothetical protein
VKGLTLNYRASQIVYPATLEKMLKGEEEEVPVRYPHCIQRTHQHDVRTIPLVKKYQTVYDQRQLVHHYNTLPYKCYVVRLYFVELNVVFHKLFYTALRGTAAPSAIYST